MHPFLRHAICAALAFGAVYTLVMLAGALLALSGDAAEVCQDSGTAPLTYACWSGDQR